MPLKEPAPKRFAVLVLDFLVTAIVISAVLAALLPEVRAAVFKARFVEVLSAMSTARAILIERHAHTGAWSQAMDGARSEQADAGQEEQRRTYRVSTADGTVAAAGTLSGRRFAGGMRPAVANSTSHWSVLWLCGARQPPAGWAVTAAAAPFDLPDGLALSVCREALP